MPTSGTLLLSLALAGTAAAQTAPYEPTWESLEKRPAPAWYLDAKFGIFIHWGVYAVPAFAPVGEYAEGYWNHLNNKGSPTEKHHAETFGASFPGRHAYVLKLSGVK